MGREVPRGPNHIPSDLVVACVTAQRKPPEVRICRLRNQSCVGTRPPSTSTPHWPACLARCCDVSTLFRTQNLMGLSGLLIDQQSEVAICRMAPLAVIESFDGFNHSRPR